jgi:hypothetical protein
MGTDGFWRRCRGSRGRTACDAAIVPLRLRGRKYDTISLSNASGTFVTVPLVFTLIRLTQTPPLRAANHTLRGAPPFSLKHPPDTRRARVPCLTKHTMYSTSQTSCTSPFYFTCQARFRFSTKGAMCTPIKCCLPVPFHFQVCPREPRPLAPSTVFLASTGPRPVSPAYASTFPRALPLRSLVHVFRNYVPLQDSVHVCSRIQPFSRTDD